MTNDYFTLILGTRQVYTLYLVFPHQIYLLVCMEQYAFTAIIAVASVTAMIALLMGLEKMVRVIMANYFIASIILAFTNFIDLITGFLVSGKTERRVD